MTAVFLDAKMDDEERRNRLYAGDIFIYSSTPATEALSDLAKSMLEAEFAPHDPRSLHKYYKADEVAARLGTLKPAFIHHPECKKLIPQIMIEHGVDPAKLYYDVPRLRSAYPAGFLSTGIAYAFHAHRDTWYSAPMSQINWWMPVFPIEPDNAMNFYPDYFDKPVKNNSEIYNYYEWNTKYRGNAAQFVKSDTREQPKAQQEIDALAVQYITPPGGIVVFSGSHLHETVPNTTQYARYSIDFRTVHLDDLLSYRGARNIDSRCTGTTMRDYINASDGELLPESVIALYDDETAGQDKILRFGDRMARKAPAPTE